MRRRLPVVLYVPNLLGYARIVLALLGLSYAITDPVTAVQTWILSAVLDFFDGVLARKLNQSSTFGVFLDICADNILRTCVWFAAAATCSPSSTREAASYLAVFCCIICLEWTTMVSTQVHAVQNNMHWKRSRNDDPWIVKQYFHNNFRNPMGCLGIYGLFSASMFAYACFHPILYQNVPCFSLCMYLSFAGRFLSMTIEVWFCYSFITYIIENDENARKNQPSRVSWQKPQQSK